MDKRYSVFDASINRLLGVYDTEDQALDFVDTLLRVNSDDYADDLVVGCSPSDDVADPLTGDELRARVRAIPERRQGVASQPSPGGFSGSLDSMVARGGRI
jgi:hypothetical protein